MTAFILKKYEEKTEPVSPNNEENNNSNKEGSDEKEILINIEGSISEIVFNALNKSLKINETNDVKNKEVNNIKAITTEDINLDPATTYEKINKDDIVYISNEGFRTAKEEWFLSSIANKTNNVFYTLESLNRFLHSKVS